MFAVLALLSIVVCSDAAAVQQPKPVAVALDQCTHQGKTYAIGEKTDSACQPCTCMSGGQMACLVIDCFFPAQCVDAVHKAGQCCSSCPNGPNCKHGNHIIKHGETYNPDANTECTCSKTFFGQNAHQAVCIKKATAVMP